MKTLHVLVTGGSGVVGDAAVRALVARGHTVRLLARHADDAVKGWPRGVEARVGDVTDAQSLSGAADGCDALLHLVAIVDEDGDATFERVNVEGTRHIVDEARRANVPHVVYVSSLGAERGHSPYHRSKLAGEEVVRAAFGDRAVVVRLGNVYGPGDEQISMLLRMVRALPVVPVLGGGKQAFQPLWAEDAGAALASAVENTSLGGQTLDVAGPERTSIHDLLDRFEVLTDRHPTRLPVPTALASLGIRAAEALDVDLPLNGSQLTMLVEGNVIEAPAVNALDTVLGVTPTSLDAGLTALLDSLPEQLPEDGVGALHHKRFWADVVGATGSAESLFRRFRMRFQEVTPGSMDLEAEPDSPTSVRELGQTVTMALPARGNVQVRVAELSPTHMTLQTVEGHVLAGAVRVTVAPAGEAKLRVEIDVFSTARRT